MRQRGLPAGVDGVADPRFAWAVRGFAAMFPGRRFGGGAMAVYLDGQPVVDVWTGHADRRGRVPWSADTAAMVFSATKGVAATVIHRLADRGLIAYDAPVAHYWPEFGANGKAGITVAEVMRHRAGLSGLRGVDRADVLDHRVMEARLAAARPGELAGKPAYHALTFGWLMSGLARAVTGMGMAELIRREIAAPLDTDGIYLGRPPAGAPTRVAEVLMPQTAVADPLINALGSRMARWPASGFLRAVYFPDIAAAARGDTELLDAEIPAANGVLTARGLARMYGAIANRGVIDDTVFLSRRLVAGLTGPPSLRRDRNLGLPLPFHRGYHAAPFAMMPGFGHVGLGGSFGWADPADGLAFAFVHNRFLTPFVVSDHGGLVTLGAAIRRGAAQARRDGFSAVTPLGAPFRQAGQAVG